MVRKKIDWKQYDHLIGCCTDANLASVIGCSESAVTGRRKILGITANFQLIDLSSYDSLLGTISDRDLAQKAGCSASTVSKRRNQLGIPPFRRPRQQPIILANNHRVCNKCAGDFIDEMFLISLSQKSYSNTCRNCRNSLSRKMRLKRKKDALMLLGGGCAYCGFNELVSALQFHHVGKDKDTEISRLFFLPGKREELLLELDKCCCLCSNHHDAFHAKELELHFEKVKFGYRVVNHERGNQ